jgi:GNAT superfamily N-acetyltransferase
LDVFRAKRLYDPAAAPGAFFVAVEGTEGGGHYVGYTYHRRFPDDPTKLRIAQTGVRKGYRRRGIGLALKLRGIAYARDEGYRLLRTVNESNNRGILEINQRLGFARLPAWLDLLKTFGGEG